MSRLLLVSLMSFITACMPKLAFDPQVANAKTYTVKSPTNGKHHAIFQIRMPSGGGCTAFAISNRRAITAGHCVEISRSMLQNKKELTTVTVGLIKALKVEIERTDCEHMHPKFVCEQKLRGLKSYLKDRVKFLSRLNKNQADVYKIINSNGVELKVKATAIDSEFGYRDFAVLSGDFSEFEKLPLAKSVDLLPGQLLRSCGYANLKIPAACTNFITIGNSGFAYKGNGYLVKGMSGGPVINDRGEVVGINVAVALDEVLMTPVVGVLNQFPKED